MTSQERVIVTITITFPLHMKVEKIMTVWFGVVKSSQTGTHSFQSAQQSQKWNRDLNVVML